MTVAQNFLRWSLESVVKKTAIVAQMVFGISSSRNLREILYCGPDDPLKYYLKIHKNIALIILGNTRQKKPGLFVIWPLENILLEVLNYIYHDPWKIIKILNNSSEGSRKRFLSNDLRSVIILFLKNTI